MQIDLGIAMMNYGIAMEWDGQSDTRPDWMRQNSFVPCDCEKCFFCLNGLTNGIAHKSKKRKVTINYAGSRITTDKCTTKRMNFGMKNSDYCRMCYRKQDDSLSSVAKKDRCKTSILGCPQCHEPICKACWEEGYDRHAGKKPKDFAEAKK